MSKSKRNNPTPLLIIIGGGFLLIVAAFFLSSQNARVTPVAPTVPAVPAAITRQAPVVVEEGPHPEIPRVSLEEAKAAFDDGSAVFVDVRITDAYDASHVAGAINLPLAQISQRLGELDQVRWIITYCT